MPAYSFKKRFIEPIKNGSKTQTIRGKRKNQAKKGDTLYLYYGMRTKWCTKIGEAICEKTCDIEMSSKGNVFVNGDRLSIEERNLLAVQDGFKDFNEMYEWWDKIGLPFRGDLIFWEKFKEA